MAASISSDKHVIAYASATWRNRIETENPKLRTYYARVPSGALFPGKHYTHLHI